MQENGMQLNERPCYIYLLTLKCIFLSKRLRETRARGSPQHTTEIKMPCRVRAHFVSDGIRLVGGGRCPFSDSSLVRTRTERNRLPLATDAARFSQPRTHAPISNFRWCCRMIKRCLSIPVSGKFCQRRNRFPNVRAFDEPRGKYGLKARKVES